MAVKLFSILASVVATVAGQSLLQPLPSQYSNRSDIVYIANNLAVIPLPFNYTGGLYLDSFTSLNVSNSSFAAELKEAGNASFFIFDPRFIDILGPNPQLELFFNLSMFTKHQVSSLIRMSFSWVNWRPQINSLLNLIILHLQSGIFLSLRLSFRLMVGPMLLEMGNCTWPLMVEMELFQLYAQADPVTMTSKVLVNNFRGLHLNSPDDVVVNNSTGLVYFTDPFYAYVSPSQY